MNSKDRILVTGGSGFLGGRLVETLAKKGVRIRVATSDFRHCARVARFPVELVKADLVNPEALTRAAADCDIIFHFGYRFGGSPKEQQQVNVEGTRALAEALLKSGGKRLVHISSVAAYGPARDGDLVETSPPQPTTDAYANTKLAIEHMLFDLYRNRGLPMSIIQPTVVYGPYGPYWTVRPIEQVNIGRVVLPAQGLGLCNAVYVDDLVAAALLAAEHDAAVGQAFLISGSAPTTWREFYGAYEAMAGKQSVLFLDEGEMRAEERRQHKHHSLLGKVRRELARRPSARDFLLNQPPFTWLDTAARQLPAAAQSFLQDRLQAIWNVPTKSLPVFIPDAGDKALFAAKINVRIDKARRVIGYEPAFDLTRGMALTRQWARWANLVESE
jgi:nucleoside-diphosphate-sugar epimerase